MTLLDQVIMHVKSVGYKTDGVEHQLLNDFVTYLGSKNVVSKFSTSSVVIKFISELVPQPDSVEEIIETVTEPIIEPVVEVVNTPAVE